MMKRLAVLRREDVDGDERRAMVQCSSF